ncbi:hypothetical protein PF005_g18925 [Phytophthora fragariae]|uniref:Uncharacterized protein n=2 Tax=Phytophthora fragariae TaxID=53985 RepID=A0A6A3R4U4_9STRA|nr:hypothetical protein PF003_g35970 [Phytophthora fragariae]KAE9089959.1 hypothetical protein PF007_g19412 [Phytophthora fragariae]KAE9191258.1 hypothetical protein PF005_g18925 [Phytophthora fragariae]KAE9203070.1 hypothetical protein PF004_g18237 [Phytophthora fragariae]KAE9204279.1 hypothetical protein PF002_g20675 [Phytophthora fragariae]
MMTEMAPVISTSMRGEEVHSAINATSNPALLEDVLKANGEEHLFSKIMELAVHVEDEPPVIFGWQNVEDFVQAIQAAQAQAAAPGGEPLPADPLHLPAAVNVQNFKEAVLEYARVPGAAARLDSTCLPCSQEQFGQVIFMLGNLESEAWIQRIIAVGVPNSLPIAHVYVPRPHSNTLGRVTPQIPNSLWG